MVELSAVVRVSNWYQEAVIYELPVKSFHDSNHDGIGDFPGLIDKLEYVESLGVTCLWLLPFFPSPLRDDGYDISDYCQVHPSYGTLEDFKRFLDAAHGRGLRVVIELVLNHTSEQHAWFQRARQAPAGSVERDFYVWSDTDTKYRDARILFADAERSNWTWDTTAQAYYWHRFFHHQPDLNFDNPEVLQEILRVVDFWLGLGVDGFRLDAVPYLVEREGTSCENLPGTHNVLKAIRRHLRDRWPHCMLLAEANQTPADLHAYFADGDECHMAYHFPLMPRVFMGLHVEDRQPIVDVMRATPQIPANCQWALFLRNHDELTLELVNDDERDYMHLAYSSDPQMRLNLGIRRRLAPLLDNNRRRIELLNSLLFSFPGTPIVYYGDEIGMGDNTYLGDRNGVRTPMQWTSDRNARFSRADPARLYSPVIMDPIYGYQAVNVEAQERDGSSLLQWMRNIIGLRKLFPAFGLGDLAFIEPVNRKVLAYLRRYEGDTILCVANLSRSVQPVELDLSAFVGMTPVEMIGYTDFPVIGEAPYFLTLGPYGFYWFELQRRSV
jgi:maltose alpha-D-glucosyltransferase/alpha-amylase